MYKYTGETLGDELDAFSGPDSWGVDFIYVHTLCEILEAYDISLETKRAS